MGFCPKYEVELIGASCEAIDKAEDRELFDKAMKKIGLETPRHGMAHDMSQAHRRSRDRISMYYQTFFHAGR